MNVWEFNDHIPQALEKEEIKFTADEKNEGATKTQVLALCVKEDSTLQPPPLTSRKHHPHPLHSIPATTSQSLT